MSYELIVVGGGIGGLTTAALLAARGVRVCLFEREAIVGGCVANFEHQGYTFEPTAGLYAGWEPGGIHERIFSELRIAPPNVQRVSPAYVVRLADHTDVIIHEDQRLFEDGLRKAFPECADAAIHFYRQLAEIEGASRDAESRLPEFKTASRFRRLASRLPKLHLAPKVLSSSKQTAAQYLAGTSERFQWFVDAQLQMFRQCSSEECSYADAAATLIAPSRGLYAIAGGGEAVATALCDAIRNAGGTVRLNAPVLRLAYDTQGRPVGVDLLNGETVHATRAIVSNLTIWDTYGKLIGLSRTPANISSELKLLRSAGAYLMFIAMDQSASLRLTADHFLLPDQGERDANNPAQRSQFFFSAAPEWDGRAPEGKRSATVWTWSDVEEWFIFHENADEHEKIDQRHLETSWAMLHAAMPELGDGAEIIETATPQAFYEKTRRKLGMVGRPNFGLTSSSLTHNTIFPNVFMVGDTVSTASSLADVSRSALILSDLLTAH